MALTSISLGFPLIRTIDLFSMETQLDAQFTSGSLKLQLIFGTLFIGAILLLWQQGQIALRKMRHISPFLLLLVCWCAFSIFWSPYPIITLKREAQLVGLVLIGLAISLHPQHFTDFRRALLGTLTGLLLISLLVILLYPAIGVDSIRGYAWRGIFWHKNLLGASASVCLLLWLDALLTNLAPSRAALAAIAFTFMMLIMAKSSTALLTAMGGCTIYLLAYYRIFRDHYLLVIVPLILMSLLLPALLFFFVLNARLPFLSEIAAPIAGLVGRSADFTGRTDIWQLVLIEAMRHPLQGIGYGGFWQNAGSPSQYIIDALGWVPLQSHNGYLDIFNELGVIGLLIFLLMLIWHLRTLFQIMPYNRSEAALHLTFLTIIITSNLSESQLFNGIQFQNNLFIFLSIMATTSLYQYQLISRTIER